MGPPEHRPDPVEDAGGITPPASRLAIGLCGFAVAAFFGVLAAQMVLAPINDPELPMLGKWALRAFIGLMFGSMTALGGYGVYYAAWGCRGPVAPRWVRARCPACGELRADPDDAEDRCGFCDRAAARLVRAWREPGSEGFGGLALGTGIGGAILSLGVMLASGAIAGPAGVLMRIAYGALALLLAVVGAAMVVGAGLGAQDAWRKRRHRELRLHVPGEGGQSIGATAKLDDGALTFAGATACTRPIEEVAAEIACADTLPRDAAALAHVAAALHARGDVTLAFSETLAWTVDEAGALTRTQHRDVQVSGRRRRTGEEGIEPDRATSGDDDDDDVLDLLDVLEGSPLCAVLATLAHDGERRRAFEAYADRVATEPSDPGALRVLAWVLRDGGASPPYRSPG